MKTFLLILSLTLGACISAPIDTVPTDGAMGRQLERVLSRHDAYVQADAALPPAEAELDLAQSAGVRSLAMLGEVRRGALAAALAPVADRHDAYVKDDLTLEQLEVDTYLASTESLRRVLEPGAEVGR